VEGNGDLVKLILSTIDQAMYEAFELAFQGEKIVVVNKPFEQLKFDCIVTAGNSRGVMQGGIDLAVARFFPGIENAVQGIINDTYFGELPVGSAFIVTAKRSKEAPGQWVVYSPTMRNPGTNIAGTDNPYFATHAALIAINSYNRMVVDRPMLRQVETVVMSGMGSGVGGIAPFEVARQMYSAWSNFARR